MTLQKMTWNGMKDGGKEEEEEEKRKKGRRWKCLFCLESGRANELERNMRGK